MQVVNNVISIKSNKKSMTTVSIEETDESWALKLLNDFEADDQPIIVEEKKFIESEFYNDYEDLGALTLSLTAIENQFLMVSEKQKAQELAEQTIKRKQRFNVARIVSFFKI